MHSPFPLIEGQMFIGGEDGRHGLDNCLRKKLAYVRA
jgi:hypothetical protein